MRVRLRVWGGTLHTDSGCTFPASRSFSSSKPWLSSIDVTSGNCSARSSFTRSSLHLVPDAGHPCLTPYTGGTCSRCPRYQKPFATRSRGAPCGGTYEATTGYYSVMRVWGGDVKVGTSRHLTSLVRDAPLDSLRGLVPQHAISCTWAMMLNGHYAASASPSHSMLADYHV